MTSEAKVSSFLFRNHQMFIKAIIITLLTGFIHSVFAQNTESLKITPAPSPIIISSVIGNNGVHLQSIFQNHLHQPVDLEFLELAIYMVFMKHLNNPSETSKWHKPN